MSIWDEGLSVSWGIVLTWLAVIASGALLAYGWQSGEIAAGQLGVVFAAIAATMTIIRDGAKTRRCMRAVVREQQQERVRSI